MLWNKNIGGREVSPDDGKKEVCDDESCEIHEFAGECVGSAGDWKAKTLYGG